MKAHTSNPPNPWPLILSLTGTGHEAREVNKFCSQNLYISSEGGKAKTVEKEFW